MKLLNVHLTRQYDIIPSTILSTPITIIGAGAIGGWTCLSLAKAGFSNIAVYDFDSVEEENLNSQFFRFKDIGKLKVDALANLVKDFTKRKIVKVPERYTGVTMLPGIIVSAVDSMAARRKIWETHAGKSFNTELIVDPRMGAEEALLYAMRPMDKDDDIAYTNSLYSDESAVQERCTAKATIYTANMLSGLVVKTIKDYLVSKEYPRVVQWNIAKDDFIGFRAKA